jgi:RHS repeat-associated protein
MEKRQKYVCSYDQAGNLVKTIPPTGVDAKHSDAIFLDEVSKARMNVKKGEAEQNNKVVPSHTLVTDYRYNTLNQVAAQQTPDAGQTKFFYDLLGRLAVSQNAQQKLDKKYSYTLYDNLGRIIEVGQKPQTELPPTKTPDLLQKWLAGGGLKEQITRTSYDLSYYDGKNTLKGFLEQRNLRNRVSYSMVFDKEPDPDVLGTHSAGTFYSYDIHGNVDTLLQDFNEGVMKATGNRFKKIAYDYDLISGKVNKVSYQADWEDEFYHKYFYDAENRLTDVYSSANGLLWQKDARYSYYRHGPLAKTILGQNQVQGIDYAYTLQGWLKGVNSTAVDDGKFDIGADGVKTGNTINPIARDGYGFGLHYFGGDYMPINNTVLPFAPIPNLVSLYNGNIAAMSVNIPKVGEPLLNSYKYDQLNRLTKMNTYKGLNPQTNNWNAIAIDDYGEEISYDANGNILTYKRNGSAGKLDMDKMTYQYPKDINGKILNNRLRYVHDEVNAANYADDIDNQTPLTLAQVKAEKLPEQQSDNYVYDAIGNLIEDKKEGINKINWNVYGKIESIEKQNSTIRYSYDASGNRIFKELQTLNNKLQTIYSRDASGNVMSTYTVDANINNGHLTQNEVHLYGSSRLGIDEINRDVQKIGKADYLNKLNTFVTGNVRYEMSNHLGNVLVTVSDKKIGVDENADGIIDYYNADVISATDYAPFGMGLVGRKFGVQGRYGFNGKENDNEVKGEGNQQDYGMRIYDTRLGRFLSVDPITKKYPELTPYQFASNTPIAKVDIDGLEGSIGISGSANVTGRHNVEFDTDGDGKPNFDGSFYGAGISQLAAGVAAVTDIFITRGKLTQTLIAADVLGTLHHNGTSNVAEQKRRNEETKRALSDAFIGIGISKVLGSASSLSKSTSVIKQSNVIAAVEKDGFAIIQDASNRTVGKGWLHHGELNLSIKTVGTELKGQGNDVFKSLYDFVNNNFDKVKAIRGTWRPGMPSNLDQFNAFLKEGKSLSDAALKTFTGNNAKALGFKNVEVLPSSVKDASGVYKSVDVLFKKE